MNLNVLLPALQRGDKDAFDTVVQTYRDRLVRHAFRIVGDWHAAEDIVQDTLLKLPAKLVGRSFLTPRFLYGAVSEECLNYLRKRARRRETSLETAAGKSPDGEKRPLDPMDSTPPPDELVALQAVLSELHAALERLPDDESEVIVRRYFDGRTQQKIAESLGVTDKTVRNRETRAKEKLRRWLAEDGPDLWVVGQSNREMAEGGLGPG